MSTNSKPDLSIIIPTKSGEETIEKVLESICNQHTNTNYEIIIIDSGSKDRTLEIANQFNSTIYEIPPSEFSHSKTRNKGAKLSRAEKYILFLNQDAIPIGQYWIEGLIKIAESDYDIKGVCATEIDITKTAPFNLIGVSTLAFRHSLVQGTYIMDEETLALSKSLDQRQLRPLYPFTTVCALVKKEYFLENMFDSRVNYGEDLHWAVSTVNNGHKVACTTEAKVFHHTYESESEHYKRWKLDIKLFQDVFGKDSVRWHNKYALSFWLNVFHKKILKWLRGK